MRSISIFIVFSFISCSSKQGNKQSPTPNKAVESLVSVLDTIWRTEQEPIRLRDSLGKVYGYESSEFQKADKLYHRNHAINEKKILEILDSKGWPSKSVIGEQGNLTICNVLQHSDLETRNKYLPLMRKAVNEKELAPRLLARAEDRLATDRDDLQIYGGQIKYYPDTKSFNVWPIINPENVDQRRAEIGLPPMAEFLSNLRNPLVWNLEEQMKRTEEFKKERQDKNQ